MSLVIQYIIIFALFIFACYVVFKPFFKRKKNELGCGKGCGCSANSLQK
ncbi:FeoB-associated Cys-rich membrane protein [Sphingobacterium sp. HJSM2_6]